MFGPFSMLIASILSWGDEVQRGCQTLGTFYQSSSQGIKSAVQYGADVASSLAQAASRCFADHATMEPAARLWAQGLKLILRLTLCIWVGSIIAIAALVMYSMTCTYVFVSIAAGHSGLEWASWTTSLGLISSLRVCTGYFWTMTQRMGTAKASFGCTGASCAIATQLLTQIVKRM